MNPLKCEQYFYLLSGKEKFRSSKGNQRSREEDNHASFPPAQRQPGRSPAACWSQHRPGGVWARALRNAARTANAPLPQQLPSIFDIQPELFCEENEWATYGKINCFSRISMAGRGWFSCPQTTLFLRLLGCLWTWTKPYWGFSIWCDLFCQTHSLIHFSLLHQHRVPNTETKEQLNWPILLLWH